MTLEKLLRLGALLCFVVAVLFAVLGIKHDSIAALVPAGLALWVGSNLEK